MTNEKDWQAHYTCDHCKEPVYVHDAVEVTKHLAQGETITLHFCNQNCANEFYLERLRATEGT